MAHAGPDHQSLRRGGCSRGPLPLGGVRSGSRRGHAGRAARHRHACRWHTRGGGGWCHWKAHRGRFALAARGCAGQPGCGNTTPHEHQRASPLPRIIPDPARRSRTGRALPGAHARMNIVVVNDFAHVNGGVAQVALSSAQALAERGHRVFLLTAVRAPGQPADAQAGRLEIVSTDQQEIAADANRVRAATQGLWNIKAQRVMRSLLERCDPGDTIIHLHGWTKALSSSVIREGVRRGYPMITTLHEYFSACPNGGFFNYQTLASCPLVPLSAACICTHCDSRSYPQKLWRVARQVVQHSAGSFPEHTRHFITLSRFSERILKPYLASDAVIHPVRNPICVARGKAAPIENNSGFIFVGRLSPEKGGVLMASAAASLKLPVTFVGDGPMREKVVSTYRSAQMLGWLPGDQVLAELRRARALVLPSLWYEAQPLVVGEAAAL